VSAGRRANGEGSIYPYRDGMFAAYVWVSTPDGKRRRKYVYGKTRESVHTKWLELHRVAAVGPVSTTTPTLSEYMTYWLREVVTPSLKAKDGRDLRDASPPLHRARAGAQAAGPDHCP
jgi:hypothetical protein